MSKPFIGALESLGVTADLLIMAAEGTASATRRVVYHVRRRRNRILRAGPDTPLWNELANAAAARLTKRGDKAQLARILGLPRQRIHQILVARTAYPDAERTLLLLAWVHSHPRRPLAASHRVKNA